MKANLPDQASAITGIEYSTKFYLISDATGLEVVFELSRLPLPICVESADALPVKDVLNAFSEGLGDRISAMSDDIRLMTQDEIAAYLDAEREEAA